MTPDTAPATPRERSPWLTMWFSPRRTVRRLIDVFGVFGGSFLLALVGGWLGGQGDAIDVRQGVAWSYVPMAATAFFWIPRLLVYGEDAFNPNRPYETLLQWLMLPLALAIGGAMLWCIPLAVAALAEALRVSIPRSVAVVTITALPVLLLALLQ